MSWIRRSAPLAIGALALIALPATPALGLEGPPPITLQLHCGAHGEPTDQVALNEAFTGLTNGKYYDVKLSHDVGGPDEMNLHDSAWYVGASGTFTETYIVQPAPADPGTPAMDDLFTWNLYDTSAPTVVVQSGDATVAGPICTGTAPTAPAPPAKPTFGSSPDTVKVAKGGKFSYDFTADPKLHGTITFSKGSTTWVEGTFKTPAKGDTSVTLKLGGKHRKALKKAGHEDLTVVVTLTGKGGTSHASTDVVLKPKS